ncbi:MAG: alkaline phosphatase family protein [Nocardioidaceae bacterium]
MDRHRRTDRLLRSRADRGVAGRAPRLVAALLLATGLGACATDPAPTAQPGPSRTPAEVTPSTSRVTPGHTRPPSSRAPSPSTSHRPHRATTSTPPTDTGVGKLVVVVVENHSLSQMRAAMPRMSGFAERFGYADHYDAITHPSLPNYLAMAGGSTFGVTNDKPPSVNGVRATSVFGQATAAGRTAGLYADGMPTVCATADGGDRYAVRHNPWAYFLNERASCRAHDRPIAALAPDVRAGRLPDVSFVIPNTCNDAHDCSLATADAWIGAQLDALLAGPDWASGHLAIVVTADEDDHNEGNRVLTLVLHPALDAVVVHTPLTHFSLSRALSEVVGAPPLGQAAQASSLLDAFGLHAAAS